MEFELDTPITHSELKFIVLPAHPHNYKIKYVQYNLKIITQGFENFSQIPVYCD